MQVVSGMSVEDSDGNWRKLSISLDEVDFLKFVAEGKVPGYKLKQGEGGWIAADDKGVAMTVAMMYRVMQKAADVLLINQMRREKLLTDAEAKEQIAAL